MNEIPKVNVFPPEIIIEKENAEMFEYFTNRPKKLKFDVDPNGVWCKLHWSEEALQKRKELYIIKRKERYRQLHPKKEFVNLNLVSSEEKLSQYLKNKMGLVKKRKINNEVINFSKKNLVEIDDKSNSIDPQSSIVL